MTARQQPSPRRFGRRVKRERERQGMSQRQLAKKCGVSFSTISRAEEGGSDIALSSAIAIASTLGLSLDWLLSEPECGTCDGIPPEGFICGECGRAAVTAGALPGGAEGRT